MLPNPEVSMSSDARLSQTPITRLIALEAARIAVRGLPYDDGGTLDRAHAVALAEARELVPTRMRAEFLASVHRRATQRLQTLGRTSTRTSHASRGAL